MQKRCITTEFLRTLEKKQKKNRFCGKNFKKVLTNSSDSAIISRVLNNIAMSPSGKATDSDSVIS